MVRAVRRRVTRRGCTCNAPRREETKRGGSVERFHDGSPRQYGSRRDGGGSGLDVARRAARRRRIGIRRARDQVPPTALALRRVHGAQPRGRRGGGAGHLARRRSRDRSLRRPLLGQDLALQHPRQPGQDDRSARGSGRSRRRSARRTVRGLGCVEPAARAVVRRGRLPTRRRDRRGAPEGVPPRRCRRGNGRCWCCTTSRGSTPPRCATCSASRREISACCCTGPAPSSAGCSKPRWEGAEPCCSAVAVPWSAAKPWR